MFAGKCLEGGFLLRIPKRLSAPLSVSNFKNTDLFPFLYLCNDALVKQNTKNIGR